jgi:CRP-like cAMP-binding protein
LWEREKRPARSLLLREGAICSKLYFIRRGCVRAWFHHQEKDICFQFFFEGDVVYAPESLRMQTPSLFNLETIEPCILYSIGHEGLAILRDDQGLYDLILDRLVTLDSDHLRHFFSFLKDTPRQRFENLIRDRPEILQRVPLQYVASYLGITQVSLSRIRNQSRSPNRI